MKNSENPGNQKKVIISNDKAQEANTSPRFERANNSEGNNLTDSKPEFNLEKAIKAYSDIKIIQLKLQGPSSRDWYRKLSQSDKKTFI